MTSWTNTTKTSTTYTNQDNTGSVGYITTDTPDYVLLGSAESEYLIWREGTTYSNQTKN